MREIPRLNRGTASDTGWLEFGRGMRNSRCSGEMRRYLEEHRWRRRHPRFVLRSGARFAGWQPDGYNGRMPDSADGPFYLPGRTVPTRTPQPGEPLWSVVRDGHAFPCE